MASLGHVAVGVLAARVAGVGGWARMVGWGALSLAPDLDVVGLWLGVPYGAAWGHRGASHSLVFALCLGACIGSLARARGRRGLRTGLVASLVLASHPLLDMLTDGGLGCAWLWPFSERRAFAPWTPIPVAPIGLGFWSAAGLRVALVEAVLFSPLLVIGLWPRRQRRKA